MSALSGKSTIVVGASRGLGRGIATAFGEAVEQQGSPVTPQIAGTALVELVRADTAAVAPGYRLSGAGLQELSRRTGTRRTLITPRGRRWITPGPCSRPVRASR